MTEFFAKIICGSGWMTGAFAGFAALLLCSCNFRPLEVNKFDTRIEVEVNIQAIANVTCDVYNEKIPLPKIESEVFRVLFFDTQQDRLLSDTFIYDSYTDPETGSLGIRGDISILPGDYRMMIYTFGTESTIVGEYDSWDKAYAYTSPLSEYELKTLALKGVQDETINHQPDHLLLASSELETIPYHSGLYTITAQAKSIVESYYLQVKVEGLEYVASARAVLTSMVPSAMLSSGERDYDNPSSIYIELTKSDDRGDAVVCNVFNTFGRIPESENKLSVTFDLHTVDGRTVQKEYDISDLFLSEECINHHWLLIEDTIVVPPPETPPSSGGGFDPVVGDWEREEHEIEL